MSGSGMLAERARRVLAGGVSSDARLLPNGLLFVDRAAGAHLIDADGRRYTDYVLGQGPAVLGHSAPEIAEAVSAQAKRGVGYSAQHLAEVDLAETLCRLIPAAERVRFNSVGSEAVHAPLRLARGHTGRRVPRSRPATLPRRRRRTGVRRDHHRFPAGTGRCPGIPWHHA